MDMVVTIPKSEYANDDDETRDMIKNDYVQFWTLSKTPRKLLIGDRVFFVKNQVIESSMRVIDIKADSEMICETTGRRWAGKCQIVMDDLKEEGHIAAKGFQGFRYRWW